MRRILRFVGTGVLGGVVIVMFPLLLALGTVWYIGELALELIDERR